MLSLRPHQSEVVEKISQGFEDGHRCQLLYAPTGFGKTEVAMALMKEVARNYKKTAMVLDRVVLVDQTSTRLSKYRIDHGVMMSGHWRFRPSERIQICSAQTLEKRKNKLEIDLLIIDECHVQRASIIEMIKANPRMRVIGLTATPFTKGLGDIYTHVVGAKATGELIREGWLTPLRIFIAKEIDMTGATKVAGEWSQDQVSERGMKITGDIVAEWIKQTNRIFGRPRKTVVFSAGVAHGQDLARQFKEQGYNFVSISYKEDDEFKRSTIEDFARPDTQIHGLIATDILTRGFDVPDVMIGVSARPFSKSFSSHVQQMGRVMRPFEGKEYGVWLDHSGNYLRFRNDWEKLFDEGVTELTKDGEKAKKEPSDKEKKEAKCPACGALWTFKGSICGSCGFEKPIRGVASVAGEMHELEGKSANNRAEQQDFYSELLFYAKSRGFKDGWAAHKYKEKYSVFPRGLSDSTKPASNKTLSWIRSRQIAWSKSKARTA
ncbi:SSL2 DNA or RNA helicases of superfamily II [uncultured Caudovirales phage]|uniref:SSL2 DNA or RNA helicases of superfamily II n=1 Tax=uncultured Caudovirales phage TaxID=2100421 RepID=A0A6J7X4W0_9CAUD|nr:SSL2 DNA or RNA helicases of superfamily II [uncultured Caudovirales phage]